MPISPEKMALYPGGSIRSPEWLEIRARIQARAGDRCEGCGIANGAIGYRDSRGRFRPTPDLPPGVLVKGRMRQVRRTFRVVCTTAHVDGELFDHSDGNLKFWCQRCHNGHDAKRRAVNAAATRRNQAGDRVKRP